MAFSLQLLHIVAGALSLVAGFIAAGASKGTRLHRHTGWIFVVAMITMTISAAVLAISRASSVSFVSAILSFHLVATSFLTIAPPRWTGRWVEVMAMYGGAAVYATLRCDHDFRPLDSEGAIFYNCSTTGVEDHEH